MNNTLPNGCDRATAERRLAMYDMRKRGGYKNQQIAAYDMLRMSTGMKVRELRRWLADHPTG